MEELLTTDLGICNTRRELFGQLFEELIRQEMIACKVSSILTNIVFRYFHCVLWQEKGLLLLRIRTELKQTLMSYQELFEKSIVCGRHRYIVELITKVHPKVRNHGEGPY